MRSCCCGGRLLKRCKRSRNNLLPLGRKAAELGIVVQRLLLLVGRKILIAAQPLSGVIAQGLPPCLAFFTPLLDALSEAILGMARRDGERHHECGNRRRRFRRDGLSCDTVCVLRILRHCDLDSYFSQMLASTAASNATKNTTDSRSHPAGLRDHRAHRNRSTDSDSSPAPADRPPPCRALPATATAATEAPLLLVPHRSPLFIRTRLTPTTISSANDAASTGLRSHCSQPADCFARYFFAQTRAQADIKIRRGFRRLPLVQQ